MKKLIFLFAIMFLFSCEKKACYLCEITAATTIKETEGPITTVRLEQCGLSGREIKDYEKANTKVIAFNISDSRYTGVTWSKCKCNKEDK
jgi:hypothetical protein